VYVRWDHLSVAILAWANLLGSEDFLLTLLS